MTVLTATSTGTSGLVGRDVTALAVERNGDGIPGAVWAVVDGRELWRSGPGAGAEWQRVASWDGAPLTCVACLAPAPGGVVVGTAEAHVARLSGPSLEADGAFDELAERKAWYTPWGGPPDTRSIAVDPGAGEVFVNVHVGGVARGPATASDATGASGPAAGWDALVDIHVDVHQVIVAPDGSLLIATGAAGFGRSTDRGATWAFDSDGLHGSYCRAVAVAGDTVLLTASQGPHGSRGAVYRRPLGASGAWERVTDLVDGNIDTFWLDADVAGEEAAFLTAAGDLWRTTDAGATWTKATTVDGQPRAVAVL